MCDVHLQLEWVWINRLLMNCMESLGVNAATMKSTTVECLKWLKWNTNRRCRWLHIFADEILCICIEWSEMDLLFFSPSLWRIADADIWAANESDFVNPAENIQLKMRMNKSDVANAIFQRFQCNSNRFCIECFDCFILRVQYGSSYE